MENLILETYQEENSELEEYLSSSIISFGIDQLRGKVPRKLSCCFRDNVGKTVAAIMGSVTLNLFFISHLFVDENFRNKGLGTELLSAIESLALSAGCNVLRLNTLNKKAHAFYLRAGFDETASIPDYMTGFDLIYYHKRIG